MISPPSRRILLAATTASLWLFLGDLAARSQERPKLGKKPYETRPPQVTASCPERSKVVLTADPAYDRYRWFRGEFATTLEEGELRMRGVEMTEWANCSEIEIGPGDWFVVMSKVVDNPDTPDKNEETEADAIIPFKVSTHKKPQFTLAGVPPGQVRPRSEVVMTITPAGGTEYKSYRLFELDHALQTVPGVTSPLPPKAVQSRADQSKTTTKGQACIQFETRRSAKPTPTDPASVIAYLGNRARQAQEEAERIQEEVQRLEDEISQLERESRKLEQDIREGEQDLRELKRDPKVKEADLEQPSALLERQNKSLSDTRGILEARKALRDEKLLAKARQEREHKFFKLYREQASNLAKQIKPTEEALFEANVQLRNDSDLEDHPFKSKGFRRLTTRERREFRKVAKEAEQRISDLYGGIAAFAVAEPTAPGPPMVQTGSAPDATIRVAPDSRTLYLVELTDANGCTATQLAEIDVRKLTVDMILGTQFSTYNANDIPAASAEGGEPPGVKADDMMPPATPDITEEDRKAFDEAIVVAGIRLRHAYSAYTEGYGEIMFGGLNVEVPSESAPANTPAPAGVVRDARVVEFEFGFRYAFMESLCDEGLFPRILCSRITGEQIQLQLNGRYGWALLAQDDPELDLTANQRGDFLDRWFIGFTVRNDNPGHLLDESFVEFGWGRSDNFADNDERFKANAEMVVDLGAAIEWDFFLQGRFDSDRGVGTDDLRVTVGFQREMTSFLRSMFGTRPQSTTIPTSVP
jgi:hypothetical protein